MKTIERLPVFGYGGSTYFFSVYPLEESYPDEAGVYIFTKRVPAPNAIFTVVYIGHTPSFSRLVVPKQCDCLQINGINSICLLRVEKEEDRLSIMRELRERLRPICNNNADN